MTVSDFRRLALSLDDAEENSHMGSPDFRVGGKIFATSLLRAKVLETSSSLPSSKPLSSTKCPKRSCPSRVAGAEWA